MLEFVRRNRVVLTSGSLLLVALLLLSTGARDRQRLDPLSAVLLEILRPAQTVGAAAMRNAQHGWRRYVALTGVQQEKDALQQRVHELEQQLGRVAEIEATAARLEQLLGFSSGLHLHGVTAQIIGRDSDPWAGALTINRGESDGVLKNMAVLSPQGVVGQTTATTAHSARVLLLTDHNSGIDAMVQRSRARGIVQGALDGGCVMKYVQRGEDIDVGDRIITSGLDGIFPKGVDVGAVTHVTRGTRGLLQVAEVKPSAAIDRLEEVLVVRGAPIAPETTP